ncbi:transcriptional activator haa1 [Didymosphaeria variabile]|uniref:Transcriptional activator haa1 n=1 Tax=Didymosphaeria variabile TaxID=1932322 RepID=A0A9W8XU77_9PLEO|nr:transcriptional activator haa1 [Didymosphaeria variabile]KAJ4359842.1 transcriptional activator haa1 [Didymosphaeria variabile]
MPIIDGEKYACQSCIKGHRVSGCNHTDRELHHINPKGRPVKQCEHCRGARKSKSHHAKCECGDRKDKHKDKGDSKGEQPVDEGTGEISNPATVHDNHCGCHSGAKCICGIKKEPADLRLDTSKQTLHDVRARPKVTATHSESNLTVFANGHHRPCHRNNNTAHISGAPYKIPRPHTLHGSAFEQYMKTSSYSQPEAPAQRSADTFSLSNRDFYTMLGAAPQIDALPLTPISGSLDTSNYQESIFANRSAAFPQENCSPTETHLTDAIGAPQWPWSNSLASVTPNFGYGSLSTSPSQDCLSNLDTEWPIPSAGLTHPTWSAGDLPLDTSNLADSVVQPISHSGESKHSAPELSTSSSPSEIGEQSLFSDIGPASAVSETLFWEDKMPVYRPTLPNEVRPPTSAPQYSASETQGLELDLSKALSSVAPMPTSTVGDVYAETPAIAMPNPIDEVASNDPWAFDQTNLAFTGFDTFDIPSTFPNWI